MNDPLTELATVPPTPIHGALQGARASVRRIAADLLAISDDRLEHEWRWRPTDTDDVELRYPARRYVVVDDKVRILAAIKAIWRERVTTVFVRQGSYAMNRAEVARYPPADVDIDRIGEIAGVAL